MSHTETDLPPRHTSGITRILGRQLRHLTQVGSILAVHGGVKLLAHLTHQEDELWVKVLATGSAWLAVVEFFLFELIELIGSLGESIRDIRRSRRS